MSTQNVPAAPTFTSPSNNSIFPEATTQLTLSWTAVPGAAWYAVRAEDVYDPGLRVPGNDCVNAQGTFFDPHYFCRNNLTSTSIVMPVRSGHSYTCWVHAVNAAGYSATSFLNFRIAIGDAAEFVFQCVPYVLQPGETLNALVKMRNVGSTTWTPAAGYRLGSQNPQDSTTFGTHRVLLPAGAQVAPWQEYDFVWQFQAPAMPGTYNFQWRMVHDGVQWFGDFTENVKVKVVSGVAPAGKLTRDAATGRILADNIPVTLRGGHYDLFEQNGQARRSVSYTPGGVPFTIHYTEGIDPCQKVPPPNAYQLSWEGVADNWAGLFKWLRRTNTNLLRVWLTGGVRLAADGTVIEVVPYQIDPQSKKYKVREAVESGFWNAAYFTRLSAFAQAAEQNGVYLQVSLFNYLDLLNDGNTGSFRSWSKSVWNPSMCTDLGWGQSHLVWTLDANNNPTYPCGDPLPTQPPATAADIEELRRHCAFINPQPFNGLPTVQSAFVKRVVQALMNRKNIIFEVMNEPHRGSAEDVARFSSRVVGWIIQHAGIWRPLTSVNAVIKPNSTTNDMDWWKGHGAVSNYDQVDIISYHGLTGYLVNALVCTYDPHDGKTSVPAVDQDSIRRRLSAHGGYHPNKACMFSTDAARVNQLAFKFNVNGGVDSMHVRDGQIITTYRPGVANPWVRSDLGDWAYWCLLEAAANPGYVHFQNHSTHDLPYCHIGASHQRATSS
jgi:hypothetical protein